MTDESTEPRQVPVSSDWAQQFFNTVGFYPFRGEAQPAAPPAETQPPASGQGQTPAGEQTGSKATGGEFNWGLFPGVPEDQRTALEPHLKDVQGHVTQLEQKFAPIKDLAPDDVQALAGFGQKLQTDPVQAWLDLGTELAKNGISGFPDLDIDAVAAVVTGADQGDTDGEAVPPGTGDAEGDVPPWATQLMTRLDKIEQSTQQRETTERQQREQQILVEATAKVRAQLKEANIPDDVIADDAIHGFIVSHRGDLEKVVETIQGVAGAGVKGLAQKKANEQPKELDAPHGAPKAPERGQSRDGFREARGAAEQYLKSANAAQE